MELEKCNDIINMLSDIKAIIQRVKETESTRFEEEPMIKEKLNDLLISVGEHEIKVNEATIEVENKRLKVLAKEKELEEIKSKLTKYEEKIMKLKENKLVKDFSEILTGVHFVNLNPSEVQGYVKGSKVTAVRGFNFEKEIDKEKIVEVLWKFIEKAYE